MHYGHCGTTNYILSKMADEGLEYETVLKEAQKLGYAEANPTADVDGYDSMYKLSILSSLAFHTKVPIDKIYREGISNISKLDIEYGKKFGYTLKLLAIGKKSGKIEQSASAFIQATIRWRRLREFQRRPYSGRRRGRQYALRQSAGDLPRTAPWCRI